MILTKKQTEAIDILEDNTTTELLFGGGAGGGKSALGCYYQIKKRIKHPGTRGLIGRSKLKVLKDTTLKTFFEIAKLQGLKRGVHFDHTGSNDKENPNSIVFYNGSLIYLRDLFLYPSDPEFDDLGSLEITDGFIDECNQVTKKAKDIVKSRMRFKLDEYNLIPKLLLTCNPSKNWTYRDFYKPHRDSELQPHRKFIQSLLDDNPNISKHYRESLLTIDIKSKERLLYGNWEYDDDPSTLIDADSIADYWNGKHVKPEGNKYITVDVARKGKDKTVARVWHGWVCINRVSMDVSLINEVVDLVSKLMKEHSISKSRVVVDEDGVGGGVVDYLKCKGFVNNSKALRGENYENLKSQCSIIMADMISQRKVSETSRDSNVIESTSEEMEQVKEKNIDKDGKRGVIPKDKIKDLIGRSPDDWDTIMMRVFFVLNKTNVKVRSSSLS